MPLWSKLRRALVKQAPESIPTPRFEPEQAFREFALETLAAVSGMESVRPHPSETFALQYRFAQGAEGTLYLGNLFRETREMAPELRARRLRSLVLADRSLPQTFVDAAARLCPVIRSASYVDGVEEATGPLARRAFAPHLFECVGLDSHHSITLVTRDHLAAWNTTLDEVLQLAADNLRRHCMPSDVEVFDHDADYPIFHVAREDSYQSSRLALPGWLAALASLVQGRPVAAMPERDMLIVSGDGDERALLRLYESAEREYRASPRSLSPELYTLDDSGHVVRYRPERKSPAFVRARHAHTLFAAEEYATQRQTLAARATRLGKPLEVSEFVGLMRERDGIAVSYCTWAKGACKYLPETDLVVMLDGRTADDADVRTVTFAGLRDFASGCLEPCSGHTPQLWRVVAWPTSAQWKALRGAQTTLSELEPML